MIHFIIGFLFISSAFALELEGVNIPQTLKCAEVETALSGYGLRTATWLRIKVYVLAVYAPKKITKDDGANPTARPLCFELTYLKDFDNDDVDKAWDYQFKESSQHSYAGLKDDIMNVKKYFGPIKGERKESFVLTEDKTFLYENGALKGEIAGKDFQRSFLSMWFGTNPPSPELKESLLKGK